MSAPRLALTMGDPAGIGPEVVIKAWPRFAGRALFVGDADILPRTAAHLGLPWRQRVLSSLAEIATLPPGVAGVWPTSSPLGGFRFGVPNPACAPAVVESIRLAVELCLSGVCEAMATPPLNKAALHAGGFDVPGHTELLARFTGAPAGVMMLVGGGLRVVPATIHQSLASVPATLTPDLLQRVITLTREGLIRDFGLADPRIAVAALNPHAGEGGAFGREEETWLRPLCRDFQKRGWRVGDPLPADTLFHAAARREYDVAVCMYHDQALIPVKTLAFGRTVNVTLGLPVVRASVDHGTAYDIAGQGVADARSMEAAMRLALRMARCRRKAPP